MKNRMFIYIVLILLLAILSGCWNRREMDTLAIVQAIGIDKTENGGISLTIQIIKPGEIKAPAGGTEGGGGKGVWTLTSTGETVFDAFRNATTQSDRKLFLPFMKAVVIGEAAAQSGIIPLVDFLDRDHESRRLSYVFIARGNAKDIIEAEHEQETIPAKGIEGLARATFATSKIPKVNLHEFLKTLASKTSDPFLPGIETIKKQDEEKVKKVMKLDGTAIFKNDELMGWFDGKETRGLLWVLGEVKSGIIIVRSPQDETKKVSLEIIQASSKVKPEIIDDKILMTVKVKVDSNIGEQMSQADLTKPSNFKELEKRQAAVIEEEVHAALGKAKSWDVDIFKFGEAVHRKFPKDWVELEKKWKEVFKDIQVKAEIESELRRIGMSNTPVEDD